MSLVTPSHETSGLMAILENPELFKKRLEQLQETERKTQAVVDLAGPADEIVRMRAQIEEDKNASDQAIISAQEEAGSILDFARDEARGIVDKATQEANSLASQAQDRAAKTEAALKEATENLATLKKESQYLDQRENTLTSDREKLVSQEANLSSRENQLLQEKSELATVRETLDAFLR